MSEESWMHPYSHTTKCMCGHETDHAVTFHYWKDEKFGDDFTVSTSLNHYRGFWSRCWIAIKYALGVDNTHYFYTEQQLNKEEVLKLKHYLDCVADQFNDHS